MIQGVNDSFTTCLQDKYIQWANHSYRHEIIIIIIFITFIIIIIIIVLHQANIPCACFLNLGHDTGNIKV